MIISASRRTDIPAFYSDWFLDAIAKRTVTVKIPRRGTTKTIDLSPQAVDCIVFWTKNPRPLMERLSELADYKFYFQFTLNPYEADIEPNLPNKKELVNTFAELADMIGPERVILRYDPIIISDKYTLDFHRETFSEITTCLKESTKKVTISFVDTDYRSVRYNMVDLRLQYPSMRVLEALAADLAKIAHRNNLKIDTCAEPLSEVFRHKNGIAKAKCIDPNLITALTGKSLWPTKDRGQRQECGCATSFDIGVYNTCPHGCKYCYANYDRATVKTNCQNADAHYARS